MKSIGYFFLVCAVIAFVCGFSLIVFFDNYSGFMGLTASAFLMLLIPLTDSLEN